MVKETVLNVKLFVNFVTAYIRKIVTLRIKEAGNQQTSCVIKCRRLAWTKTFIDLNERFLRGVRIVFIQRIADIFIVTEKV
ncbi:hypothetical protein D3C72_801050 [compost metagenome]